MRTHTTMSIDVWRRLDAFVGAERMPRGAEDKGNAVRFPILGEI